MAKMIAKRAMTFAQRRLVAGDEFTASAKNAKVLSAIGRATYATRMLTAAKPVTPKPTPKGDDLADLRAQYQELMGKRPYHGWGAEELKRRIDEGLAA